MNYPNQSPTVTVTEINSGAELAVILEQMPGLQWEASPAARQMLDSLRASPALTTPNSGGAFTPAESKLGGGAFPRFKHRSKKSR